MKILGIDPGLIKTGYGLIEAKGHGEVSFVEAGVIRTSSGDKISKRVTSIYENLCDLVSEHKPNVIVLEKLYSHYKHPITAILMGHVRGITCLVSGINGIPLVNYPATKIKKAITGNGQAGKQQVQRMVKTYLKLKTVPEDFDVSDALAMALCYVFIGVRDIKQAALSELYSISGEKGVLRGRS